jgi:hypothetical protein
MKISLSTISVKGPPVNVLSVKVFRDILYNGK